jgi:hypothetical protein
MRFRNRIPWNLVSGMLCAGIVAAACIVPLRAPIHASTQVQPAPGNAVTIGNIVNSSAFTGQTTALGASTVFTVGSSDANFRIDYFLNLAAGGVAPVSMNVIFTDSFGNVQTVATNATGSGFGKATSTSAGDSYSFRAKANTNIQVSTSLGTGSTPTYNLYTTLVQN